MTQTYPYPTGQQTAAAGLGELVARLAGVETTLAETTTDVDVQVAPSALLALATTLRDHADLRFDFLRNVSGVDYEAEGMALKYQFYSFTHGHALQVSVATAAGHPHVPSLVSLYPAADWFEREASEMFGFQFDGHPNLRNLLLEEDLHIHPLLKAHPLQAVELLQGIESGPPGFTI
jgi:NADH-quinone oxidoreductase subunit C